MSLPSDFSKAIQEHSHDDVRARGLAAPNLFKLSGLNSAQAHQQSAVSTFDPRALRCSMTKITREGSPAQLRA
jgi:hypothetical protein